MYGFQYITSKSANINALSFIFIIEGRGTIIINYTTVLEDYMIIFNMTKTYMKFYVHPKS